MSHPARWAAPALGLALAVVGSAPAPFLSAGLMPTVAAGVSGATLSISGPGIGMYPAFSPQIERYAVTTTSASTGAVTLAVATTDPQGTVWINGRRADSAATTVSGLTAGDEISVIITGAAGEERHSLYYLPAGFPTFETPVNTGPVAAGHFFLTPVKWWTAAVRFEAVVDRNGVPIWSNRPPGMRSQDLKRQPNGNYTVARAPEPIDKTGNVLVVMDEQFREIQRYKPSGGATNDSHDSILLPAGEVVLLGSYRNPATKKLDAVIEERDPAGTPVFTWTSAALARETVRPLTNPDYAHMNSVVITNDGKDFIVSFRHFSSVLRIARVAHDGFQPGQIVWRLGGRRSSFRFVNDPYPSGPCAQHTASELPNGNTLLYDNGSSSTHGLLCINPRNPSGAPIARPVTRVSEYRLDLANRTATLVWSYNANRFSYFAGSARRLAGGNTLIGWAQGTAGIASEVSPSGRLLWQLRDRSATIAGYNTYRAEIGEAPDAIAPVVTIGAPASGAAIPFRSDATVDFACTDRGGSSLASCGAPGQWGSAVDTDWPGPHTITVTARDGAENTTTLARDYVVDPPAHLVDLAIRADLADPWTGDDTDQPAQIGQQLCPTGQEVTAFVRLQNDGSTTEPITVGGSGGSQAVDIAYFDGANDVTAAVVSGTYQSALLAPGETAELRVAATCLLPPSGGEFAVTLTGTSGAHADSVSSRISLAAAG